MYDREYNYWKSRSSEEFEIYEKYKNDPINFKKKLKEFKYKCEKEEYIKNHVFFIIGLSTLTPGYTPFRTHTYPAFDWDSFKEEDYGVKLKVEHIPLEATETYHKYEVLKDIISDKVLLNAYRKKMYTERQLLFDRLQEKDKPPAVNTMYYNTKGTLWKREIYNCFHFISHKDKYEYFKPSRS